MARKRPMTTEELFNRINGILKEKGKLPDNHGSPVSGFHHRRICSHNG